MKAEVKKWDGKGGERLFIEAGSYLELFRVVGFFLFVSSGKWKAIKTTIVSAFHGYLKVTDAGRANYWQFIALILFFEKLIGWLSR